MPRLGFVAALVTVLPAIGVAFFVAFKTFWWCPEGGCSLEAWPDKWRALGSVSGTVVLIAALALLLQFPFVLIARVFCGRKTVEDTFLRKTIPGFAWYDSLMRKWIRLLWRP